MATGVNAEATGESSTAIGDHAKATGEGSFAAGKSAEATDAHSSVVGDNAAATGANSIATGTNSLATGESSVAVGDSAVATGEGSIAFGKESTAIGAHSSAIGESSIAYGEDSSAIGHGAVAEGNGSFAGGADSRAYGKKSVALGDFSTALGHNSTAIGHGSATIANNSVALVAGSIADEDNTVSVGSVGYERRITNLADGVNPHDAVNIGQLRRTEEKLTENISKVGAGAAAMANLQPLYYEHDDKVSVSAAVGNYNGQTAMAVGAYYRPNSKMMFSVSGSFGSGENMIGAGISAKFDKTYEIDRMSEEQLKNKIEMLNENNAAHSSEYSLTACDLKHPGYSCHVFRHSCGTNFTMRPKICVWCSMCYVTGIQK